MTSSLQQQRAIITGASSGIGKATALSFAQAGCNLVLVGRSLERLTSVGDLVSDFGVEATVYPLDLSQLSQVQSHFQAIAEKFGPIDLLINNAGIVTGKKLLESSDAQIEKTFAINTLAHFCVY